MRYEERLRVPVAYWLIGMLFGLPTVVAVLFSLGDAITLAGAALTAAVIAWALVAWGSATIRVDDRGLTADGALLEWEYVASVEVLDEAATREALAGTAARRAYLVARPYLHRAVEVRLADPADPHPSWLITTRRPAELAEALAAAPPR